MSTVDYNAVYLLHQRPYTDSKILVELLSKKYGRISAVYRASKKSRSAGGLTPFRAMEAKWGGKGHLKTLHALEPASHSLNLVLSGKNLFCGLYLNELLTRALPESDVSANEEAEVIFNLYEQSLKRVVKAGELKSVEPVLRKFEFFLLATLGFGIDFTLDTHGVPIQDGLDYHLVVGEGFSPVASGNDLDTVAACVTTVFAGGIISSIGFGDFNDPVVLKYAKLISRRLLPLAIGDRPLKSRELFS